MQYHKILLGPGRIIRPNILNQQLEDLHRKMIPKERSRASRSGSVNPLAYQGFTITTCFDALQLVSNAYTPAGLVSEHITSR